MAMCPSNNNAHGFVSVESWTEFLGKTELGVWCYNCQLSSAIRFKFAVGIGDEVKLACEHFQCHECKQNIHMRFIEFEATPHEPTYKERFGG